MSFATSPASASLSPLSSPLSTSNDSGYQTAYKTRVIEGPGLFYLGIIDYLQKYTLMKRLERLWKRFVRGLDKQGISDVPPREYRDRMMERVIGKVAFPPFFSPSCSLSSMPSGTTT